MPSIAVDMPSIVVDMPSIVADMPSIAVDMPGVVVDMPPPPAGTLSQTYPKFVFVISCFLSGPWNFLNDE